MPSPRPSPHRRHRGFGHGAQAARQQDGLLGVFEAYHLRNCFCTVSWSTMGGADAKKRGGLASQIVGVTFDRIFRDAKIRVRDREGQ